MTLVRVTREVLERGKSRRGGWSREQMSALGEGWPLEGGWRTRILSRLVKQSQVERFLSLKDSHLAPNPDDQPQTTPCCLLRITGPLTADLRSVPVITNTSVNPALLLNDLSRGRTLDESCTSNGIPRFIARQVLTHLAECLSRPPEAVA